jgi:hypothetical protein
MVSQQNIEGMMHVVLYGTMLPSAAPRGCALCSHLRSSLPLLVCTFRIIEIRLPHDLRNPQLLQSSQPD